MEMSKLMEELSPMRDTQYWHDYLHYLLAPSGRTQPTTPSRKPPPPPLKPKPRLVRQLHSSTSEHHQASTTTATTTMPSAMSKDSHDQTRSQSITSTQSVDHSHFTSLGSFLRSNSLPSPSALKPPAVPTSMSTPPPPPPPSARPLFSSSSFFDHRSHPSIEEQVTLCREIAKQLVSDTSNAKSKGREMFEKRVEKSASWVTENEDSFQNYTATQEDFHERTISEGPPNLKLLLDPRRVEDISTVQGVNEHISAAQEKQTRDTCRHIVQDLTSPEVHPNRGNALFARRVQKSEEWIVDEVADSVIDAARDKLFRNVKHGSYSPARSASPYSPSPSIISGPVFTPVPPAPSSSTLNAQFKDFNARAKPFCRAY